MKKVLIVGARGMLGQELVRVFKNDEKYEVIGWDKEEIDVTDQAQVEEKIGALAPQVIINAAAYNAVDKCEEPEEFRKAELLNGLAPGFLAGIAKEIKIPLNPSLLKGGGVGSGAILVHYSSDYVFNGEKKEGYREDDVPSPINKYGQSKLLGERNVAKQGGKYYIVRLQKLFGQLGQSAGAKKSFFEIMLALAEVKKELEVVDEELANFSYAPDLAGRTKYIVEQNLPLGIYHITNEGWPVTWYGATKILFAMVKKSGFRIKSGMTIGDNIKLMPVSSEKFPRPARRPKYSVLLNTKLPPLRPWPEALREFLKNIPAT